MTKTLENKEDDFPALLEIVTKLRGPNGCPWDKEQTHKTLTQYAIEEVFELVEAIEKEDTRNTLEELGDVLFQVVLHSQIAQENQDFSIQDVIETLNKKMIRRHPHVFANKIARNSQDVIENWEDIKKEEKRNTLKSQPFDIPPALPALQRSYKIGKKTAHVGFDWSTPQDVLTKVKEELNELENAPNLENRQEEMGDLLFSIAQLARHMGFEPEQTLRQANKKFENRYQNMLHLCQKENSDFPSLSLKEKELLWQKVKKLTQ